MLEIAEEVPSYLREMQLILTAGLMEEAKKQTLTLSQIIRKMKISGMADGEIEKVLLNDLIEGGQIFGDFRKQMKATVKGGIEDAGQGAIHEAFIDVEPWDWLGIVDKSICADCLARHNMPAQSWDKWKAIGLPRAGATICGKNCRCDLVPAGAIEKEKEGLKRIPSKKPLKPVKIMPAKTVEELDKQLAKVKLTDAETKTLTGYTWREYLNVNRYLRDERLVNEARREYCKNFVPEVSLVINKLPRFNGIVYRGMAFEDITKYNKFLDNIKNNKIMNTPTFTSASLDKNIAKKFATVDKEYEKVFGKGGSITFEIKSKNGNYVGKYSGNVNEKEIIFDRNTKFEITGIKKKDNIAIINLEEL